MEVQTLEATESLLSNAVPHPLQQSSPGEVEQCEAVKYKLFNILCWLNSQLGFPAKIFNRVNQFLVIDTQISFGKSFSNVAPLTVNVLLPR